MLPTPAERVAKKDVVKARALRWAKEGKQKKA